MRILSIFSLLLAACLASCSPDNASAQDANVVTKDITVQEFLEMDLSKYHLVDVRTPEEYAEGHIEGSVNINWNDDHFMRLMSELSKDRPTIVYCRSGGRSKSAMKKLAGTDFPELYNVLGGYLEYAKVQH